MIPVLFITYNRLPYTKRVMEYLLKTTHPFKLFIWDNGSTDGTDVWLKTYVSRHPAVDHIEYRTKNLGINVPFNEFIRKYKHCEFIAKVDNDTLVESKWLEKLLEVMKLKENLDAAGAFMQRPPSVVNNAPWTFQRWVDEVMKKERVHNFYDEADAIDKVLNEEKISKEEVEKVGEYIAYNSYTGGTGVLIRTKVFWDHGLLFEKYPCLLGDWTTFQRLIFNGKNIAWYSGTTVQLLNIKKDGEELNNDFPEYEAQLKVMRDEGNEWYSKVGGAPGVATFIEKNGGREKLNAD